MLRHWLYLTLLALMLSACQIGGTKTKTVSQLPSKTPYIFTEIAPGIDTPYIPKSTPTTTPTPPANTIIPSATNPPVGIFAIEFYPPLVFDYQTDQWIDKSDYGNKEEIINYLQNIDVKTCTINPMGASGFYPENMKKIYLGSIRYQILLNQSLTTGNVVNYYFALSSSIGSIESQAGVPHFAVQSSSIESEKCIIAAEKVLATLHSPDQSK
jgi:hypothetical protein